MPALVRRRTSTRVATGIARRTIGRLPCAIPVAAMLTTMAGSAFAQNCTGVCADEVALMSSFIRLPNSAAGLALLNANLQAEESIYLNSTQAQKVTAAANVLLQYMPANVLIGAFPTDPRFLSHGFIMAPRGIERAANRVVLR